MDKSQQTINEGIEAAQLLESPAFTRAVNGVREAIVKAWENAPIRDTEGQHELRLMRKLLDDLTANLRVAVADGKFTENELKIKRTSLEQARKVLNQL